MFRFRKSNNNEIKPIIIFLLLIGLLIISGVTIITPNANAILREQNISIVADKDTAADEQYPSSNAFANSTMLPVYYSPVYGYTEAYFYFDFSNNAFNITQAEIVLDIFHVGGPFTQTLNTTVCLIEEYWGESSLTWVNRPNKGPKITMLPVNADGEYRINVTDYILGRTNISICLFFNYTLGTTDGFYITASEADPSIEDLRPQLSLIFIESARIIVTSPSSSDIWEAENNIVITWTSTGMIDDVIIELYNGSTFDSYITPSTENDGQYEFYLFRARGLKGNNFRIKIVDYNDPLVYDYSEYFTIKLGVAIINITNPTSSSSWKVGNSYNITWTSTGPVTSIWIEMYKGDIQKDSIITFNTGSYLWEIPNNTETGTDWRIKISNNDNTSEYDWSDYFEIYKPGIVVPGYNIEILTFTYICTILLIISLIKKRLTYKNSK